MTPRSQWSWAEVDGVYHYCTKHRPFLDDRIVQTPDCREDGKPEKVMTDRNGDKWCNHCIKAELDIEQGRR